MKTLLSITALLATATLTAQSNYQNLGDFTSIHVKAAAKINLIQSDSDLVSVSSDNPLQLSSKNVNNGVLTINSTGNVICNIRVKSLKEITTSNAASVKSENTLSVSDLKINTTDASSVNIALSGTNVKAITKDASTLKLTGTITDLDVTSLDASTVKASELKASSVTATAKDAGRIKTGVESKINATASGSGIITYQVTPSDKTTQMTDAGVVKEDASKDNSDDDNVTATVNINQDSVSHSDFNNMSHGMLDAYWGFGYVAGPENQGSRVMYGRSREFNLTWGYGYKFCKFNGIGADIYYKSTDFFLEPDADKMIPNNTINAAQKIAFNNFGGVIFDRFYFGSIFIDGGVYYDWIFHNRYVTWNNFVAPNYDQAYYEKTIETNLSFVNSSDYGLMFRFGFKHGISFYFNWRKSNLLKNFNGENFGPPQLPPYVFGINFGEF